MMDTKTLVFISLTSDFLMILENINKRHGVLCLRRLRSKNGSKCYPDSNGDYYIFFRDKNGQIFEDGTLPVPEDNNLIIVGSYEPFRLYGTVCVEKRGVFRTH